MTFEPEAMVNKLILPTGNTVVEVLKIEHPGDYNKESWAMDIDEKLAKVPILKEEGNKLYKEGNFQQASDKYATAIGMLEQLLLR